MLSIRPAVVRLQPFSSSNDRSWTALPIQYGELLSRIKQIAKREQRLDLRGVFGQTAIANLDEADLALDHAKRMLDFRADAGLGLLDLVVRCTHVSRLAQACPLLHEMNAQRDLRRKRRTALLALGREWRDHLHWRASEFSKSIAFPSH